MSAPGGGISGPHHGTEPKPPRVLPWLIGSSPVSGRNYGLRYEEGHPPSRTVSQAARIRDNLPERRHRRFGKGCEGQNTRWRGATRWSTAFPRDGRCSGHHRRRTVSVNFPGESNSFLTRDSDGPAAHRCAAQAPAPPSPLPRRDGPPYNVGRVAGFRLGHEAGAAAPRRVVRAGVGHDETTGETAGEP